MVIMKYLKLVLCLIILNNFSGSQQQCRDFSNSIDYDQLYLLESNDKRHKAINEQFIWENSGFPNKLMTKCQLKVEDIIKYSNQFPYLINLYVPDFYQNNYNKVAESLVYAGDINSFKTKVNVCKISKDENRTCDPFKEVRKKYVKLCTNQILDEKYTEIFKKVLKFQPNKYRWSPIKKQLYVINCGGSHFYSNYYEGFKIHNEINCSDDNPSFLESVRNNTLAILAPKVLNFTRPIDNPVIFYKESYIKKETKDLFRNSMTSAPWQSLKYGFLFVIKKMEWQRVAIISDSSEYSREFEKELTTLFRENGIAYMAETCVTEHCNKVINKIDENKAKVIIANFDLENTNMEKIAQYAKSKELVRARNVIWITRDLPVNEAKEVANMLSSEIFNISFEKDLTYILHILNIVSSRTKVNCDTEPCSFSKNETATQLKKSLNTSRIKITSITSRVENILGYIFIEKDSIIEGDFDYPYRIKDSFFHCTIWNKRFEKPCNDIELILMMVVLTVFFLTVLGLVLFFQSPEFHISYTRMP